MASASVNRRRMLTGSAALVAGSTIALGGAALASSRRSPVMVLWDRHGQLLAQLDAACTEQGEAEERFAAIRPSVPSEIRARNVDQYVSDDCRVYRWIGGQRVQIVTAEGWRYRLDCVSGPFAYIWPETAKQRLITEVTATLAIAERYEADTDAARVASGLVAAEAKGDAIGRELSALEDELLATPAVSLACLSAKLAVVSANSGEIEKLDGWLDQISQEAKQLAAIA